MKTSELSNVRSLWTWLWKIFEMNRRSRSFKGRTADIPSLHVAFPMSFQFMISRWTHVGHQLTRQACAIVGGLSLCALLTYKILLTHAHWQNLKKILGSSRRAAFSHKFHRFVELNHCGSSTQAPPTKSRDFNSRASGRRKKKLIYRHTN